MSTTQATIIHIQDGKSPLVAGLLTFFFGPIGLLYTSPIAALVLIVLSIILLPLTIGLAALIIWPTAIVWGVVSALRSQSKQSAAIQKATATGSAEIR